MTFSSMEELRTYILSRSKVAVQLAQEKIYQVISRFVKEYYTEFSPELYDRTYQLFRSLVKTDIVQTLNGWENVPTAVARLSTQRRRLISSAFRNIKISFLNISNKTPILSLPNPARTR